MTSFLRAALSKLAALALLVAVIAAVFFGAALPLYERYQGLQSNIDGKRMMLGRLMAQNATLKLSNGSVETTDVKYLPGETDAVRLATLQSTLNDAAAAQDIRLISSRPVDPVSQESIRLLGVAAQFKAPIAPLQKLLFDLENQRGALAVESLQILRQQGEGQAGELDVSLVLRGPAPLKVE